MSCPCGNTNFVSIDAKCNDCCSASYMNQSRCDYVPYDLNIGGGDYVTFEFCPQCGRIQGEFPLEEVDLRDEEEKWDDEDEFEDEHEKWNDPDDWE